MILWFRSRFCDLDGWNGAEMMRKEMLSKIDRRTNDAEYQQRNATSNSIYFRPLKMPVNTKQSYIKRTEGNADGVGRWEGKKLMLLSYLSKKEKQKKNGETRRKTGRKKEGDPGESEVLISYKSLSLSPRVEI